jgi:hypothetical protein
MALNLPLEGFTEKHCDAVDAFWLTTEKHPVELVAFPEEGVTKLSLEISKAVTFEIPFGCTALQMVSVLPGSRPLPTAVVRNDPAPSRISVMVTFDASERPETSSRTTPRLA